MENQGTPKKRIEYIDAMRGVTMLLVVYSHILYFGYSGAYKNMTIGESSFLTYNEVFTLFRMPLFFFISGFVLFKQDFSWSATASGKFLLKKAKVQLIPTAFFLGAFTLMWGTSFQYALFDPSKCGYWFTLTLFEYFVLYATFRFICNLLGKKNGNDLLLILFAFAVYGISRPAITELLHMPENVGGLIGLNNLKYFVYFCFGTLVKKHFSQVETLMDNGYIMAALILAFFGFTTISAFEQVPFHQIFQKAVGFLGILLVFAIFRRYQAAFTKERRIGRILQYIGRHTLDIYLLHYFFLPRNLGKLGEFFSQGGGNNLCIEFAVSMLLASIVVSLSLCISSAMRTSPILAHWLFGAKLPVKTQRL